MLAPAEPAADVVGGCRQRAWWSKRLAASGSSTLFWCWSGCAVRATASLMSLCSSPTLCAVWTAWGRKISPYVELADDDNVSWNSVVSLCLFDWADSFFWNHLHYIDSFIFWSVSKILRRSVLLGFCLFFLILILFYWLIWDSIRRVSPRHRDRKSVV